jgi:phosphomannomutase
MLRGCDGFVNKPLPLIVPLCPCKEAGMTNSLKFGTSGLRGLATDLIGEESRRYAAAFLRYLRGRGPVEQVLVGRDLRASSPDIARSVIEALDIEVIDCGEVPTPALALEAMRRGAPAIMVTGSHIPADRNGLKFYRADGEIDKADEAGILAALADAPVANAKSLPEPEALPRYLNRYAKLLPAGAFARKRIGVWQHSSVARDLFVDALKMFGADVVALGRSDVFVPVDTEAVGAETAAQLAAWIRDHKLDAVISTDGDADRPLIVDETGALVRGDIIGILTAKFLGADAVVTPVTSNSSIEGMGAFRQVVRTKVGSPFVITGMAEATGRVVGFEANGGVLLGSDMSINDTKITTLPTRDALLPILSVLGAARAGGLTLSQLVATLPPRIARSDRLQHVPQERTALLLEKLRADAQGFLADQGIIKTVSTIDGLRYELASGDVIHYRPSGNAPELRCYTEASTAERADALLAWGLAAAEAVVR